MKTKRIVGLIASCVIVTAHADLMEGLVSYYPLTGSLANEVNPIQVATLLNGATLASDSVNVNANAVRIPAPFPVPTSVFSVSLRVYESGLTDTAGGAYLSAGEGGDNIPLMTHYWVNRSEAPEGSYYGPMLDCPSNYNACYLVAPLEIDLTRNRWVHYVFVSDVSGVSLYRDGISIGSLDFAGFSVTGDWCLGKVWWLTGGMSLVSSERILGKFKSMRVFSRALSAQEVSQLYAYDSGPVVQFVKAFTLDYSHLLVGSNYQAQVSSDMENWTNYGAPFTATEANYTNSDYERIPHWGELFFKLQIVP